jgi:hypothetical protein
MNNVLNKKFTVYSKSSSMLYMHLETLGIYLEFWNIITFLEINSAFCMVTRQPDTVSCIKIFVVGYSLHSVL